MVNRCLIVLHIVLLCASTISVGMNHDSIQCEDRWLIQRADQAIKKKQLIRKQAAAIIKQAIEWNEGIKLVSFCKDLFGCIHIGPEDGKNLRLTCKGFAERIVLPECDGLHAYRALNALWDSDGELLKTLLLKEIKLQPYRWLSDLEPGDRLIKTDDLLHTSWKKLKEKCGCDKPYGNKLEDSAKISVLEFGPHINDITAKLVIHRRIKDYSFSDRSFLLIAACLLGRYQQAQEILIEYCESKKLSEKEKDTIIPAFAISIDKNDLKMLSVFCSTIQDLKKHHKFYFEHMFLLNLALAKNKKEAFEVLSSLNLRGKTRCFITSLALRSKINRCWGELIRLKQSKETATQVMYELMTDLGYQVFQKEEVWEKARFYTGNVQYADMNCFSYKMYLSAMTNYINVDRKGRGWKTNVELFKIQDDNLDEKIHIPMLRAIKKHDLSFIENTLDYLEQNQFLYNQKRRVQLFNMHIEWLKEANRCQNLDAFYVLKSIHWEFAGHERYVQRNISKWADECQSIEYGSKSLKEVALDIQAWFSSLLKK
jgi:hypothetical protein